MNTYGIAIVTAETEYDHTFAKDFTQRRFLTDIANGSELTSEHIHFANKLLAQMNKKNSAKSSTGGKNGEANSKLMDNICEFMENGRTYTAKEIAKAMTTEENEVSTQKITALMGKLKDSGKITILDDYKPQGSKSKCKGYELV